MIDDKMSTVTTLMNAAVEESYVRGETEDSLRRVRDEFQRAHPHYTPPPWAGIEVWLAWGAENIDMHGLDGWHARFPKHARELSTVRPDSQLNRDMMLRRLRAWSYGHTWQCTCSTINTSWYENPMGHDVACVMWGTDLPNRHMEK